MEEGRDEDEGQFMLFSSKTHVEKPSGKEHSEKEEEKWMQKERYQTARWRLMPERCHPRVYDHRRDGVDAGVFGYDAWIRNPLLARLPCHGKVRTAGVETVIQDSTEVLDPQALKKMKARAKNQRRRHAKQAAKKAAAEAAATAGATNPTTTTETKA